MWTILWIGLACLLVLRAFWRQRSDASTTHSSRAAEVDLGQLSPVAGKVLKTGHWPGPGEFEFEVVGESFYQDALAKIAHPGDPNGVELACVAEIIPESDNVHDEQAVAVLIGGLRVGHLSREDARDYRRRLQKLKIPVATYRCDALVTGGGVKRDGSCFKFGVRLDMKPFE